MQSSIVQTNDTKQFTTYIDTFCQNNAIHRIDRITIQAEEPTTTTIKRASGNLGISDIRRLQKQLYFMPLKSPAKIIVLQHADTLTIEAQNALLKILEEPPTNTFIFLLVQTTESLLPTILSRCTIVKLTDTKSALPAKEMDTYLQLITTLLSKKLEGQLYYAQEFGKTKEESVSFLEKLMLTLRTQILASLEKNTTGFPLQKSLTLMELCMQTHRVIKTTNTNPRLSLENLFLSNVTVV